MMTAFASVMVVDTNGMRKSNEAGREVASEI